MSRYGDPQSEGTGEIQILERLRERVTLHVARLKHGADVIRDRPQSFAQGITPSKTTLQPWGTDHIHTVFFQKLDYYRDSDRFFFLDQGQSAHWVSPLKLNLW
jgi:hypothetical protein